jgi:hypothetical protein
MPTQRAVFIQKGNALPFITLVDNHKTTVGIESDMRGSLAKLEVRDIRDHAGRLMHLSKVREVQPARVSGSHWNPFPIWPPPRAKLSQCER